MALDKKTIDIPFVTGINEGVDPRVLNSPAVSDVENGLFDKTGGLRKRLGTEGVDSSDLPTATYGANLLSTRKDHLVAYGRGGLFVHAEGSESWYDTGIPETPPVEVEVVQNIGTFETTLHYDCATDGKVLFEVWEAGGTSWCRATEIVTGAIILQPQAIAATGESDPILSKPSVVWNSNYFCVVGESGTNLRCTRFATDTFAIAGTTTVVSGFASAPFQITYNSGSNFYVSYIDNAGTTDDLTVVAVNNSGVPGTPKDTGLTADLACAVYNQWTGLVYVIGVHASSQACVLAKLDSSLTTVQATKSGQLTTGLTPDRARCTLITDGNGDLFIAASYEEDSAVTYNSQSRQQTVWKIIDALIVDDVTVVETIHHHILATQAWHPDPLKGGGGPTGWQPCVGLQYDFQYDSAGGNRDDPHLLLVTIDRTSVNLDPETYAPTTDVATFPIVMAYMNVASSGAHASIEGYLPHVTPDTAATGWYVPTLNYLGYEKYNRLVRLAGGGETGLAEKADIYYTTPRLWKMDIVPPPLSHKPVGDELMISGGYLATFDGTSLFENAPFAFPEIMNSTQSTGTGALLADSTYYWQAVWLCRDSTGLIHRSAPSRVVSEEGPGSATTWYQTVQVTTPQITHLRPEFGTTWSVQLYQSRDDGGANLQLLHEAPVNLDIAGVTFTPGFGVFGPEPAGSRLTVPYTAGSILENRQPPAFLDFKVGPQRAMGISAEQPHQIHVTKLPEYGVGFEFNPNLSLEVAPHVKFTALGVIDEKFVLFTKDQVFIVGSDGPDNRGRGNFTSPRLVNSDTGCSEKRSVVEGPFGVIFRGKRGFYLVDRAGNLSYIGAPVEDTLDGLTITSTVVIAKDQIVKWCTTSSISIFYNYVKNVWYVEKEAKAFQDATTLNGLYHWLEGGSSGWAVGKERAASDTNYADTRVYSSSEGGSVPIPNNLRVKTAWIKLAGLQGYKRIWWVNVLGINRDTDLGGIAVENGSLYVRLYYDYDESNYTAYSVEMDMTTYPADDPFFIKVKPDQQKCTAIKVEILEVAPLSSTGPDVSGYSEGFRLSGLALDVGILPGSYRDTATRR